jgi:hypothetical protein
MKDDDLAPLVRDPQMTTPDAAAALMALAREVALDPDIACDVLVTMTEVLQSGGPLARAMAVHPNPYALLIAAAKNAALDAVKASRRDKRTIPLTDTGEVFELSATSSTQPSHGLFELLEDLGWTRAHLEVLAMPRQRAGRSIHPGIEAALDKLARCYGITDRCAGCPTAAELQRLDLNGPRSWPALVEVATAWGWSAELIDLLTRSPSNVAHWRRDGISAPPRQERRMVEIARKMRWDPEQLADPEMIRDSIKPRDPRLGPPPAASRRAEVGTCPAGCNARHQASRVVDLSEGPSGTAPGRRHATAHHRRGPGRPRRTVPRHRRGHLRAP